MIDLTARPEPLRVPVGEVVARTSLVTPLPPHADPTATLIVVQRAVRIISDPPPAPLSAPTLIDELKLGLTEVTTSELDRAVDSALPERPSTEPPAIDPAALAHAAPPGLARDNPSEPAYSAPVEPAYSAPVEPAYSAPVEPAYSAPVEPAYSAPVEPAYSAPVEPAIDIPWVDEGGAEEGGAEGVAAAIEAALADASRMRAELEAPRESPLPPAPGPEQDALEPSEAPLEDLEQLSVDVRESGPDLAGVSGEIAIDPEFERGSDVPPAPASQVSIERARTDSYADELSSDDVLSAEEAAAAELDAAGTVPPPAPPEALRRSVPTAVASDAAHARTVRPDERPSGEFEELDVDAVAELRAEKEARAAARPQNLPPPPPVRSIQPEAEPAPKAPRVEDVRPSRVRSFAWWETFFDDDYLRTVRPPTREQVARQVSFIEKRLGLRPSASVLDVGCGLGLQAIELSARGYGTVGLDLSLPMLTRAAEEAQARGARVNFLHGDMREMTFEAAFDAVTCLGTTLGYFDDDGNRKVLERLYRALKPGGALLIDVVNRDHVLASQPNLVWFEGEGCVCMEETELNFFTSRLHVKRTVIHDSGKQTDNEYAVRLYSLHELGQMLNASGFRVVEVSGRVTVPGVFLGAESPNLLIVAQRRVAPEAGPVPNTEG